MSKEAREQQKRSFHLNITVKGSRNSIYISKDVIRALGVPTYVCIKINEDMSSLAIEPGEEKEYMAFKVPEKLFDSHKHEFTVHSKSFVHELLSKNALDSTKNHPLRGICVHNGKAILFKIKPDDDAAEDK